MTNVRMERAINAGAVIRTDPFIIAERHGDVIRAVESARNRSEANRARDILAAHDVAVKHVENDSDVMVFPTSQITWVE